MGTKHDDRWLNELSGLFASESESSVSPAAPGEAPPRVQHTRPLRPVSREGSGSFPPLPVPSGTTGALPPLPDLSAETGPLPGLTDRPARSVPSKAAFEPSALTGLDGMVAALRQAGPARSKKRPMMLGDLPVFSLSSTPPPKARFCSSAPPPRLPAPSAKAQISLGEEPPPRNGFAPPHRQIGEVEAQIMGVEGRCSALTKVIRKLLPSKSAGDQVARLATGPVETGTQPVERLREAQARMSALEALIDDLNTGTLAPEGAWDAAPAPRRAETRASLAARITLDSGSNFIVGLTRNLSKGGIFIATTNCPEVGTELSMSFDVMGVAVSAKGRVCWSLPPERCCDDALPGIGVEFTGISAKDQATIDWFMAQHRAPMHLAFSA